MANFKAGDLVLIIGANSITQNIGKQAELLQFLKEGELFVAPNGKQYQKTGSDAWLMAGKGLASLCGGKAIYEDFAAHEPRHLMPLRGDEQPAQQRKQEQPA